MLLALETATERASVAVGHSGVDAAEVSITGARRHATALLPMIRTALERAGVRLDGVTAIVVSDGPGSFTGLRVGAAVAKAMVQARGFPLWTAPSLMVRAAGIARPGQLVVAVADALRGEIYAAAYRFTVGAIVTELSPSVCRPEELPSRVLRPDAVVGDVPAPAHEAIERWSERTIVTSPEGAPSARRLLGLVGGTGGAVQIARPGLWEPAYGRPAEAQARWEMTHGRPLPDSVGSSR